jgi:beta-aspartyl-peptidase (threonine type)
MRLDGTPAQQAADEVMAEVKALGGDGGVIMVTPKGDMVTSFNTPGMYRGKADSKGRSTALYSDADER